MAENLVRARRERFEQRLKPSGASTLPPSFALEVSKRPGSRAWRSHIDPRNPSMCSPSSLAVSTGMPTTLTRN